MKRVKDLTIISVLLVTTALYTFFVFIPNMNPDRVVDTSDIEVLKVEEEEIELVFTLEEYLSLEESKTNLIKATILNRELPSSWSEKDIFFKYTYLGEYDEKVQEELDEMMATEYSWKKQIDSDGNVLMGGPILRKDGTYQLHTHNAFSEGERYFLLGELLARYSNQDNLIGTKMLFGNVTLRAIWEKDTRLLEDPHGLPGGDLIISTCLELDGDRRLLSGWEIVED